MVCVVQSILIFLESVGFLQVINPREKKEYELQWINRLRGFASDLWKHHWGS